MSYRSVVRSFFYRLGYVPKVVTLTLRCGWCAETFNWTGEAGDVQPVYCKDTHRKRASEARKKRATPSYTPKAYRKLPEPTDMNKVGRCPTPFKQTHATYETAREVISRVDPSMTPYKCVCGAIHIGHRKKSKK